jgi:hypothetical protein
VADRTNKHLGPPKRDAAVDTEPPPTDRPPFDPVEFARESERMLAAAEVVTFPTVRPPEGYESAHGLPVAFPVDAGSVPDLLESESAGDALGMDAVPFVSMSRDEMAWVDIAAGGTKLLAHVDGVASIEAVCRAAGVTPDEGAALLLDLAELEVIGFR